LINNIKILHFRWRINMLSQRIVLSPLQSKPLPIYVESIGYNHDQEKLNRPHGYPHYHWLQTINGEGKFNLEGNTFTLGKNNGILLSPHTSHSYQNATTTWQTVYVTFDGRLVSDLLNQIDLKTNVIYRWETDSPLSSYVLNFINKTKSIDDAFGLHYSSFVYQFLLMISFYAGYQKNLEVSEKLSIIEPLIRWMNMNLSNPDIGINDFANFLNISPRKLNALFQETFNISPYAYFLNLRIKKAKEILYSSDDLMIKTIAEKVGFRSVSHFVATFRKTVGLPPSQFRKLY